MLATLAALRVNYLNTVILLYNRHKFTAFPFVRRGSVAVIALGVPSYLVSPLYRVQIVQTPNCLSPPRCKNEYR